MHHVMHRFGAPLVDLALRSWALGGDPAQRRRFERRMAGEVYCLGGDKPQMSAEVEQQMAGQAALGGDFVIETAPTASAAAAAAAAASASAAAAAAALGGWGHGATGALGRVPDATTVWSDWLARLDQTQGPS